MESTVITRNIRDFVSRDWEAARESKDAYWGERVLRLGPEESFRISEELRRQALSQHPGWPHPLERREDVLSHARLAKLLRRVDSAGRP
ncbi:MAG TPA: hypothetical protein VLK65_22155 [Vicinamibacteria bacterium]|nr:hypothetical protein [Vicinamibacteria bacterium]